MFGSLWLGFAVAACGDGGSETGSTSSTADPSTASPTTVDGATSTTRAAPTTTTTLAVGDPADARVALEVLARGLDSPVAFAARPGTGEFYVAEQYSGVRMVSPDGTTGELVLDLEGAVAEGNEQGVLGLAFSSDGSALYVDYTDPDGHTHVAEYAMQGDDVDDDSERTVLYQEQPYSNHNGGDLKLGPDGLLYISFCDGGSGGDPHGYGQSTATKLAKILRVDPEPNGDAAYSIPPDNPYATEPGAAPEIWMLGLRNPWRFSFDRATGDLWIGDVGQNAYEEIDRVPDGASGMNFGWNVREGLHEFGGGPSADFVDPVLELSHADGNCSVTGGFVYRGTAIPELAGSYVFADYCVGSLTALEQRGDAVVAHDLGLQVGEVTSFGEDVDGEIYVLSRQGTISKLVNAS